MGRLRGLRPRGQRQDSEASPGSSGETRAKLKVKVKVTQSLPTIRDPVGFSNRSVGSTAAMENSVEIS